MGEILRATSEESPWERHVANARRAATQADLATALSQYGAALELLRSRDGQRAALACVLCELGDTYRQLRDFKAAVAAHKESLATAETPLERARAHRSLGVVFRDQGADERAEEALLDAATLVRPHANGDREAALELARVDIELGVLVESDGRFEESLDFYDRAQTRIEALGDGPLLSLCLRRRGSALKELGNRNEAAGVLERAAALISEDHDVVEQIDLQNALGDLALESESFSRAAIYYTEARRLAEATTHPLLVDALRGLGRVHFGLGEFPEALKHYEAAIERADALRDEVRLSTLLSELGEIYEQQGHFDEAIRYHKRALTLDQAHRDPLGLAAAFRRLGAALHERGEFKRAAESYEDAAAVLRGMQDSDELAQLHLAKGELSEDRFFIGDALSSYEEADRLYERVGTEADRATCRWHMASALIKDRRLVEAHEHLEAAERLLPPDAEFERISILNLRSDASVARGDDREASRLAREALRLAEGFSHDVSRAEALRRLAAASAQAGDFRGAESHIDAARDILGEDELALAELDCQEGELDELAKRSDDAVERFRHALIRARRHDHRPLVVRANVGLGRIYRERRDVERADECLQEAAELAAEFQAPAVRARVQTELAQLRELQGRDDEAISLYEDALDALGESDHSSEAQTLHRHLVRAYADSEEELDHALDHLLAATTINPAALPSALSAVTNAFDARLAGAADLLRGGAGDAAVGEAFAVCERELRRLCGPEPSAHPASATTLVERWFTEDCRGSIEPWADPAAFAAFRRFGRSAFEAARNSHAHGVLPPLSPAQAFCWVGVANLILSTLVPPSSERNA